jgi:hypothetical protein
MSPARNERSVLTTAAIVFAMAVVCVQVTHVFMPGFGLGLAIARFGEVWGQRVLPGNHLIRYADPAWDDEISLTSDGYIAYTNGRPEQLPLSSFRPCLPNVIYTVFVSAVLTALHFAVCGILARVHRRCDPSGDAGTPLRMLSLRRLALRSAVLAALGVGLYTVLRWFWAGVDRGQVSQAATGEYIASIAFGPFGRGLLLLGAILLYFTLVGWTARHLAVSRTASGRIALSTLTAAVIVLMLFPYWAGWAPAVLGPDRFIALHEWAKGSSLRPIVNSLAPMP